MDGRHPASDAGETARGRVLVTDHLQLLSELPAVAGEGSAWLGRLLWLTESDAGPELPTAPGGSRTRALRPPSPPASSAPS
jgi:hypothetical protein